MSVTAATSASVELLTAEVRVLMVGSRQITLSVARQLDHVGLAQLEPFGRITLDKHGGSGGQVIGRHRDTGALVIATWQRIPRSPAPVYEQDLKAPVTVCYSRQQSGAWGDEVQVLHAGRAICLQRGAFDWCYESTGERHEFSKDCGWSANGQESHIDAAISAHDAWVELHEHASQLPLIVLAGLR